MEQFKKPTEVFFTRFKELMAEETRLFQSVFIYGIGIGFLNLAIPISIQTLINNIAFIMLYQPVVIISLILLFLLVLSGALNAIQEFAIEKFRIRFYYRISRDISIRLLNAKASSDFFENNNSSDLIKRYFEIMNIQKGFSYLLVNGTFLIMQLTVGLIVLSLYHPNFIAFVLILLSLIFLVWKLAFKRSVESAAYESKAKYETVDWLERLAREKDIFQHKSAYAYGLKKTAKHIDYYIKKRKYHFRNIFAQKISFLLIYALMTSAIIAMGGWLVIREQLTIGQLVASEIIVTSLLLSISKMGKYFEIFYELIVSLDKIGIFYDVPQRPKITTPFLFPNYDMEFHKIKHRFQSYDIEVNLKFVEGNKYFIVYQYNSIKKLILDLILKKMNLQFGDIFLGGNSIRKLSLMNLMDAIYIVDEPRFFEGSFSDNLTFGKNINHLDIVSLFSKLGLEEILESKKFNLDFLINNQENSFSRSQLIRLDILRAIIMDSKIIFLTPILDELDDYRYKKVVDFLLAQKNKTIIFLGPSMRTDIKIDEGYYLSGTETINFTNKEDLDKIKAKYE